MDSYVIVPRRRGYWIEGVDKTGSRRYISALREGARYHGLPEHWVQFLDGVSHVE
jgi:gamma-glutamylcyclotransferase